MSDRHLLYLIGQPGAGKSTLAAALTVGIEAIEEAKPFAYRTLIGNCGGALPDVVELGARRGSFSGTDALPMNVQPKVVAWLDATDHRLVLGEGDRLANDKFFNAAVDLGWNVRIAYLSVPSAIASERRRAREVKLDTKPQNPAWVQGRITKARRLADTWGTNRAAPSGGSSHLYRLNATRPVDEILAELRTYDDPVVAALDAARRRG